MVKRSILIGSLSSPFLPHQPVAEMNNSRTEFTDSCSLKCIQKETFLLTTSVETFSLLSDQKFWQNFFKNGTTERIFLFLQ